MIEQIQLKNEDAIKVIIDDACEKALRSFTEHTFEYTKIASLWKEPDTNKLVQKSYHLDKQDLPELTKLLQEQDINPDCYVIAVITGDSQHKWAPHRDKYRNKSVWYLYKSADAETHWYDELEPSTQPVYYDYHQVKLKKTYKLEEHVFYTFDHQEIHSVSNINGVRCNFSFVTEAI